MLAVRPRRRPGEEPRAARLRAVLSCEKCSENVRGSPAPGGFVCSPGESRPGPNDTTPHAPSTGEALPCCPKASLGHHSLSCRQRASQARPEPRVWPGQGPVRLQVVPGHRTLPRRLPRAAQAGAHAGPSWPAPGWLLFSPTSSLPAAAERWPGT